jgi:small multidrug resistance pump
MLALAITTETIATTSLKHTEGFTRLVPSAITITGYASAFWFLGKALTDIPVSTAYVIWSRVGTATIAAIGIAFLGSPEARSRRLVSRSSSPALWSSTSMAAVSEVWTLRDRIFCSGRSRWTSISLC